MKGLDEPDFPTFSPWRGVRVEQAVSGAPLGHEDVITARLKTMIANTVEVCTEYMTETELTTV